MLWINDITKDPFEKKLVIKQLFQKSSVFSRILSDTGETLGFFPPPLINVLMHPAFLSALCFYFIWFLMERAWLFSSIGHYINSKGKISSYEKTLSESSQII